MSDPLAPYVPGVDGPWGRSHAIHLLRRAGFTPSEPAIRDAVDAGLQETVDRLIGGMPESVRFEELDSIATQAARRGIDSLRGWALLRMIATTRPLHARVALMWHNHFATSNAKVGDPVLMLEQYRLFERGGLGPFGQLLDGVARDPAMLIWLDGNANVRGRPNENFARELLELFTLGIGPYRETDVRDTARAFTGWQQRDGRFRFVQRAHDAGEKRILGRSGPWGGEDAMRIVLEHDACPRFLSDRLLREFLGPEPPARLINAFAATLRRERLDIGRSLRTLLTSRVMFEARWHRSRIKSPVELVVGMARSLSLTPSGSDLESATVAMGQAVFEPPSVAGWDGHRTWLNAATMLARMNAGLRAASMVDPDAIPAAVSEPATTSFWNDLLLDGLSPTSGARASDTSDLQHHLELVLTSPEFQMA